MKRSGEGRRPGAIAVSPTTIQSMGVRTAKVEVRPLTHDTWTVGLITFNERNLSVVNTKVAGWVERLYINATGDPVRRGQALLSIYSPDLVSAQDEYLLALRNLKNLEKSPYPEMVEGARRLAEASRRRLEYFDVSAGQIEALKTSGHVKKHLVLASPAKGIVTKRMVTQGQMVQAGMPLLEVADLSTIWVDADIYQYELPWIKVGQKVEMSLNYMPGETFAGRIDYIYPYPERGQPHRAGAPAVPQPAAQTETGDVLPGADQIAAHQRSGGGAHRGGAGHRPQAARLHRPGGR